VTPRLAATLTTIVGLSMLAGWLSAFRNRAYLGWLGLAFMAVSGYLMAYDVAQNAKTYSLPIGGAALAQKICLLICAIAFLLAVMAAARETRRRLREIKEGHRAAEEALLEMLRSSAAKEAAKSEGGGADADGGDGA
jgi:hypothetical protein